MLKPTTSPQQLAYLLGTTYSRLCHLIYGAGVNNLYSSFTVDKKTGGVRSISSPDIRLKHLQVRLKGLLEELYEPHPAATAFVNGRGIVCNAEKHIRRALVFNVDISGFYDHIHFGRVKGLLEAKPYSLRDDTARIIAHMCCFNGSLPQGAPTSPVISNMICRRLDRQLSKLAKQTHAYYTRYADDITFSFRVLCDNEVCQKFNGEWRASDKLISVISGNGFSLNNNKVRGEEYSQRQVVTGLKVNKKVNVDRRYIRTTRAMVYSLGLDIDAANIVFHERHPDKKESRLETLVAGRISFIGMVKGKGSSVYKSLAYKFNSLPIDAKVPFGSGKDHGEYHDPLMFRDFSSRRKLESCIWVVIFEGIDGLGLDQELIQGTAFMVNEQVLVTCWHTFEKAGCPPCCYVYRINKPEKKYFARVGFKSPDFDVAKLEIVGDELPRFDWLPLYKKDMGVGYKLSLAGFPQLQPGHKTVSVQPCVVTGMFVKSTVEHFEVNVDVMGGLSGGPVLNMYMQVVGMVVMGKTVSYDLEAGQSAIEGVNAFLPAKYLLSS